MSQETILALTASYVGRPLHIFLGNSVIQDKTGTHGVSCIGTPILGTLNILLPLFTEDLYVSHFLYVAEGQIVKCTN